MQIKVVIDCNDLDLVADFWCAAAGYVRLEEWTSGYASLRPEEASAPSLLLQKVPEAKSTKNRLHLDLHPADGPGTVERLRDLGARLVGPVNTEFEDNTNTKFQVMTDPEDNEFCVVWRSSPVSWD